jgi:hypothetical protein
MRLSRRIAWAVGLLTIILGGLVVNAGAVAIGGFAIAGAILLIGLTATAALSRNPGRIALWLLLHAVLMMAGAAFAASQGLIPVAGELSGAALLAMLGWLGGRRHTRRRQMAIAYMSYFKD